MATHKTATEVTVASMTDTGLFQQLVSKYWLPATVALLAMSGLILFKKYKAESTVKEQMDAWLPYGNLVSTEISDGFPTGDPDALASAASEAAPTTADFLRAVEALNRLRDGDWNGAEAAAAAIRADDELFSRSIDGGASLAERLEASAAEASQWYEEHASYFENPPLPEDAPRVMIKTTMGDLLVGLYMEEAPAHCANFLKLCEEGYYDNTKLYRVEGGGLIHAGDPNSREGDPATWGQGGPEEKIENEVNRLKHFEGALAGWKAQGEQESSGSIFTIGADTQHNRDSSFVVFGTLIEGLDTAKEIAAATMEEGTERPLEPVEILVTEVL